jgi:uncharacterized RDD family membrane protein YckC
LESFLSNPDYLISTPENVDLHLEFAGVGNRILACLIDTLITYLSMGVLFVACWLIDGSVNHLAIAPAARLVLAVAVTVIAWIASFIIYFGYFIYFEMAWQGQTPGKKFAGIRVIEQNGQPVSRSSVFIRNLLRVIDEGLFLIGLLVMIIDPNERRLGDLAANTIVIRERKATFASSDLKLAASLSDHDAFDTGRISTEEYELLSSFLKRRQELDHNHRLAVASKFEEYFAQKLGVPAQKADSELFLEKVFLSYEARAER